MSQNFPPYPPAPYHPNARQPFDPLTAAKKASILMWVLGALGVIFGFCTSVILVPVLNQVAAGKMPNANQADLEQARRQMETLERQMREANVPWTISDVLLAVGVVMIAVGLVLVLLAFFVRRGNKIAIGVSLVVVGLITVYMLLNTLAAAIVGGQNLIGSCAMLVPLVLFAVTVMWLFQAVRAPAVATTAATPVPQVPAFGGSTSAPIPLPPIPTQLPPPPTGPAPGQGLRPDGLFDPAPFGVPPPPPDDTPAGTYGYPTKPKDGTK